MAKAAIGAKRVEVALTSQASRLADRLAVARGGSVNGNVSELLRQVRAWVFLSCRCYPNDVAGGGSVYEMYIGMAKINAEQQCTIASS